MKALAFKIVDNLGEGKIIGIVRLEGKILINILWVNFTDCVINYYYSPFP